jgi:ABC-type nitrate/sulfonate/bicarbonate transport system substrate-binding protein
MANKFTAAHEAVLAWAEAHPRAAAAIDRADGGVEYPVRHLAAWLTERDSLRLQILVCGGGEAPWYEGVAALRTRLDRLARTGRA